MRINGIIINTKLINIIVLVIMCSLTKDSFSLLKTMTYSLSLTLKSALGEKPPNNIALLSFTDVRVKPLVGGGLSPVISGEIHSPKN